MPIQIRKLPFIAINGTAKTQSIDLPEKSVLLHLSVVQPTVGTGAVYAVCELGNNDGTLSVELPPSEGHMVYNAGNLQGKAFNWQGPLASDTIVLSRLQIRIMNNTGVDVNINAFYVLEMAETDDRR